MGLKLVIFDLDGTLLDSPLDFDAIRAEIGLPAGVPILEALEDIGPADRARAEAVIDRHETEAVRASRLIPGAADLLAHLRGRGVKTALLTRNSRASVEAAARRHSLVFDAAVTREDHEPKPSPQGVRHLMAACGARADETVLVGDFRFDIEAGAAAGVRTVAVVAQPTAWSVEATWQAADLKAVRALLDGLMGKA
ncbi:MAG: HAD family hydrolase [Planctomycetes bacterium]|nr:HAD family hydrolase [Planctomycetota bacterium]